MIQKLLLLFAVLYLGCGLARAGELYEINFDKIVFFSAWRDVFQVPGKHTTGTKAQKYAITGPGRTGTLPEGVTEYKSPTGMVWILGRIYCTGTPEDYKAVHVLQDKVSVVPLSAYGNPYTPPPGMVDPNVDMKTPVREQVNKLDASAYFKLLAALMKDNPPASEDATMIAKMAKIGIVPGQDFDINKLDPATAKGLQNVPNVAFEKILAEFKNLGAPINGWTYSTKLGVYGTEYLARAFVTAIGLGANRPQDAIYPTSEVDAAGKPYDSVTSRAKWHAGFLSEEHAQVKGFRNSEIPTGYGVLGWPSRAV